MKNYTVLLFLLLLVPVSTFAQKKTRDAAISDLAAAKELISKGNRSDAEWKLIDAKNAIELAIKHKETSSDYLTIKAFGDIYFELNAIWGNNMSEEAHDVGKKSRDAYVRAIGATSKKKDLEEIDQQLRLLQINTYNQGVEELNAHVFSTAKKFLTLSSEIAELRNEVDAQQLYVTGMACEGTRDFEEAFDYYQKCADLDYGDGKLYATMLNCIVLTKNEEKISKTIADGKTKYPNDPEFTIAMANAYLMMEDYENAEETLQEAIKNNPTNVGMNFAIGSVYEKLGKTDQAIDAYRTTLSIDPNYFEANYNLGAVYFSEAASIQQELNLLDFGDSREKELTEKHLAALQKAEKYLKKAHESKANEYGTISALMTIYAQLEMTDDYTKMKAALDRLKNGN